jgi:hypothetical protein
VGVEQSLVDLFRQSVMIVGGVALVVGLVQLLSALGIFGHRGWGRALGLLISLVAIVASIVGIVWAIGQPTLMITLDGTTASVVSQAEKASVPAMPLIFYGIIFLFLLLGGGHFRLKEVQDS